MKIQLDNPKTITITPAETIITDKVNIDLMIDNGSSVKVVITFNGTAQRKELILWSGQDYVDIGQWTDTDVINKIKELL